MPATDIAPAALAALTDKELEILRLLTAGHTVKSIAVHLGRSEASINERLRDARRKTGVGSSRELARLVDAQKICPRNPDLPAAPPAREDPATPPAAGVSRPKGRIAMTLITTLAAAGLATAAATGALHPPLPAPHASGPAQAAAPRVPPLVGRWSLDVARIPEAERPRRVTIAFRVGADRRWTTEVEIVAADGTVQQARSTAALDGVPVPVTGTMPFIDTVALRQPEPGTLVMTLGKDGHPVSSRVYAVGKDRRQMTETIIWAGGALPALETTHFIREG